MIKKALVLLVALLVGMVALFPVGTVAAWTNPDCEFIDPSKNPDAYIAAGCGSTPSGTLFDKVGAAITAVFGVVGIVAAGVIIFGGVRYSVSQGDPGKVKKAKDTILYAVIGLIITLSAYAIVAFVLSGIEG